MNIIKLMVIGVIVLYFKTSFHYASHAVLNFVTILFLSLECCDDRSGDALLVFEIVP